MTHKCTSEEIGLSNASDKMWPMTETQRDGVKFFKDLFLCVEQSELLISGTLDSLTAKFIHIDFVKCKKDDGVECKKDEEVKTFLADKLFIVVSNQIRFDF